jgi:hypothetical protein
LAPTVGSRRLDFVIRAGSFNFFVDKINKFCGCRQQQSNRFIDFFITKIGQAASDFGGDP